MNYLPKFKDLTNLLFGRLLVKSFVGKDKFGNALWKCKCSCGSFHITQGNSLKRGLCKSCGCLANELTSKRCSKNLLKKRFGRLVVLRNVGPDKHGKIKWECQCDCGNKTIVSGSCLIRGTTESCGCYKVEQTHKVLTKNLVGKKFGRLVVIELCKEKTRKKSLIWKCQCDCGNTIKVVGWSLSGGNTKSCGCLRKEEARMSTGNEMFSSKIRMLKQQWWMEKQRNGI